MGIGAVRGHRYLTAPKVTKLPTEEFLQRVEAIPKPGGKPNRIEAAALLGAVAEPPITVTRTLELF